MKRSNIRTQEVAEEAEMQTKGIKNLFKEILTQKFSNLGKDIEN